MNRKNYKRHLAYEVLVVLCMTAAVLFICRLWPLLLLVLLALPGVLAWLIISCRSAVEPEQPRLMPTSREAYDKYSNIQQSISELICAEHPEARWIWKTSNGKARVCSGEDAAILLNRSGGYREAKVHMTGEEVAGIEYIQASEPQEPDEVQDDSVPVNYELLAFEWVDAHVIELNERCNEGIAHGTDIILLKANELPEPTSWPEVCRELERNGIAGCECVEDGISIDLAAERGRV